MFTGINDYMTRLPLLLLFLPLLPLPLPSYYSQAHMEAASSLEGKI